MNGSAKAGTKAQEPTERPGRSAKAAEQDGELALDVTSLTKRFGDRTAYENVSFTVGRGEVFGFLGPNGAGKTTMVRTLGTLIKATSGTGRVAGLPLTQANGEAIRRRIAVMPEAPGLYLALTVRQNLSCYADLYEVSAPEERIHHVLDAVRLGDRADDPCGSLSKGLRQRVALARTLLGEPELLFLDEPTSGLDPAAAKDVHDLIGDLRTGGTTIFLTTHRLEEAERLCDRVAILNTTLKTIGTPDELRDRLFTPRLMVRTVAPLADPSSVFSSVSGMSVWRSDHPGEYALEVVDVSAAAPEVTRALVASGADVLSVAESRHSLEDVYLELVGDEQPR